MHKLALAALALALAVAAAPAHAGDRNHLPKQFHGLWCDTGGDDQVRVRPRGAYCPASSRDAIEINANGYEGNTSVCKLLKTGTDRKGNRLASFYCWEGADMDKGRTATYWIELIDGQLHLSETDRRLW